MGQGGFGITYEAENTGSKFFPKVAIKEFFMRGCVRGDGNVVKTKYIRNSDFEKFRSSFIKEAKTIGLFHHHGIVEVYSVFEENNTAYMVMKFAKGETLKQVVKTQGALLKEEAIDYLKQLCEAIGVMHAKNVVHLDISPYNVILTPESRTILIEFGAAKQYIAEHTQSSVRLVKDGFSPREQYSFSSKKGLWPDIYALGALGYYLLTAQRPISSIDRYGDPDWQPTTGHAEVDKVLAKAMAMQPGERYQDAGAMQAALNGGQSPDQPEKRGQMYKHKLLQPSDLLSEAEGNESTVNEYTPTGNLQNGDSIKDLSWLEMVCVEGGSFEMGSNNGNDDEKPEHKVEISDFYLGKTKVTQEQWRQVTGSDSPELQLKNYYENPVKSVSWNDIQWFLHKLNQLTGQTYRLPTEAEWEYAARGGNQSRGYRYAGGNDLDEVANSGDKIWPVAKNKPNELGLYDMSDNVGEWCADWYDQNYYRNSPVKDPQGPSSGSFRVVRGGSWTKYGNYYCLANRDRKNPDYRCWFGLGFRLCQDF